VKASSIPQPGGSTVLEPFSVPCYENQGVSKQAWFGTQVESVRLAGSQVGLIVSAPKDSEFGVEMGGSVVLMAL
jgi:hypothetical protein